MTLDINVPGGNPTLPGFSVQRCSNGLYLAAGAVTDSPVGFGVANDENGLSVNVRPISPPSTGTGFTVYTYRRSGIFLMHRGWELECDVLLVAGGGSGGGGYEGGGGGGGGVFDVHSHTIDGDDQGDGSVIVGMGGAEVPYLNAYGYNGENSIFNELVAYGGGYGGGEWLGGLCPQASDGGCGGGGAAWSPPPPPHTIGQTPPGGRGLHLTSPDNVVASVAAPAESTNLTLLITRPVVPSALTITADAAQTEHILLTGTDQYDRPQTEELHFNGASTVVGAKLFKTVISAACEARSGQATISVGTDYVQGYNGGNGTGRPEYGGEHTGGGGGGAGGPASEMYWMQPNGGHGRPCDIAGWGPLWEVWKTVPWFGGGGGGCERPNSWGLPSGDGGWGGGGNAGMEGANYFGGGAGGNGALAQTHEGDAPGRAGGSGLAVIRIATKDERLVRSTTNAVITHLTPDQTHLDYMGDDGGPHPYGPPDTEWN